MPVKPITNIDDPRYVKALAHPLRIRILAMLEEEAASPVQLAEHLDATLGTVAYHVRTLRALGLIKLVRTRQRRGATEHYYVARDHPRFSDEAWEGLSPVAKQKMLSAVLRQSDAYATASAEAGGFERKDAHLTRTALKLDEKGWTQLADASKKWLREVGRIEEAAAKRLGKDDQPAPAVDVGLVIMLFEALPFSAQAPAKPDGSAARRNRRSAGSAQR